MEWVWKLRDRRGMSGYFCGSEQVKRFSRRGRGGWGAEGASEKTGETDKGFTTSESTARVAVRQRHGLRFADFGAGLRQFFNRGLQGGAVFYVEDAHGAVDLAQ